MLNFGDSAAWKFPINTKHFLKYQIVSWLGNARLGWQHWMKYWMKYWMAEFGMETPELGGMI